jgi:L-threonylcarbamoyladenylate synthase
MRMNHSLEIEEIINQLNQQQVVAYPTEAVFGLGCDPDSEIAVSRLLKLKNRPWQKGLILVAANYQQLNDYIDDTQLEDKQKTTILASWPGPVTWLMPIRPHVPNWLTGEFTSLAVRVSAHPAVIALCRRFGKPLVSTSANLSGMPPCRTYLEVKQQFGNDFPVMNDSVGGQKNPSEIRDALTGKLIRQG